MYQSELHVKCVGYYKACLNKLPQPPLDKACQDRLGIIILGCDVPLFRDKKYFYILFS